MKYIDADKLKVKIDSFMNNLWKVLPDASNVENGELSIRQASDLGAYKALESVIYMIDSLQQEQPECSGSLVDVDAVREDFMTEVYRVLEWAKEKYKKAYRLHLKKGDNYAYGQGKMDAYQKLIDKLNSM